jgi:hypothetical protein
MIHFPKLNKLTPLDSQNSLIYCPTVSRQKDQYFFNITKVKFSFGGKKRFVFVESKTFFVIEEVHKKW